MPDHGSQGSQELQNSPSGIERHQLYKGSKMANLVIRPSYVELLTQYSTDNSFNIIQYHLV